MYGHAQRKEWILANADALASNGTVCGVVTEMMVSQRPGMFDYGGYRYGYDCRNDSDGRIEVKTTIYPLMDDTLRIQSYQGKKGFFDYLLIIDGFNNREFKIPHDEFFKHVGDRKEIRWASCYNKHRSIQERNTTFLLKYETEASKLRWQHKETA